LGYRQELVVQLPYWPKGLIPNFIFRILCWSNDFVSFVEIKQKAKNTLMNVHCKVDGTIYKILLFCGIFIILGFLLLIPTVTMELNGF